jgi:hypothetical protein
MRFLNQFLISVQKPHVSVLKAKNKFFFSYLVPVISPQEIEEKISTPTLNPIFRLEKKL